MMPWAQVGAPPRRIFHPQYSAKTSVGIETSDSLLWYVHSQLTSL